MNKPIRTISIFCLLLFVALMVNATWLQYWKSEDYDKDPRNRRVIEAAYSRERGAILVGREPVAESVPSDDEYDFLRTYTEPFKYAHVTGFFSFYSQTGIEQSQNARALRRRRPALRQQAGRPALQQVRARAATSQLTLDREAQDAAFEGLDELPGDVQASVVAIEPSTGKILAMASLPSYDPNKLASHDFTAVAETYDVLNAGPESEPLLNRAIQTTLPPGSTFKLVTAAAAIESGKYDATSEVPGGPTYQLPQTTGSSGLIDNGGRSCGTDEIPFDQAHGPVVQHHVRPARRRARRRGAARAGRGVRLQQATTSTTSGRRRSPGSPRTRRQPEAGQSAIGQFEVRASPLQMAMVVAGIANQGVVMRPYLVDSIQSPELETLQADRARRAVRGRLGGDRRPADPADGRDRRERHRVPRRRSPVSPWRARRAPRRAATRTVPPYAWFVSFAPAQDPEVAVAVMIQSAGIERGEIAGGTYGGPIAKAVMEAVIK